MLECPAATFREVIVAFQQFITIYVNEYRCIDDHVASATKVLGILWGTNQAGGLLSYKVPSPRTQIKHAEYSTALNTYMLLQPNH
jgi:hypothetical protein